jgi:hypothetical protein
MQNCVHADFKFVEEILTYKKPLKNSEKLKILACIFSWEKLFKRTFKQILNRHEI